MLLLLGVIFISDNKDALSLFLVLEDGGIFTGELMPCFPVDTERAEDSFRVCFSSVHLFCPMPERHRLVGGVFWFSSVWICSSSRSPWESEKAEALPGFRPHASTWESGVTLACSPESEIWFVVGKNLPANAGDAGSIPGLGRYPGEGNSNPLQYSCLESPMDRGAWQASVLAFVRSQTLLNDWALGRLQQSVRSPECSLASPYNCWAVSDTFPGPSKSHFPHFWTGTRVMLIFTFISFTSFICLNFLWRRTSLVTLLMLLP